MLGGHECSCFCALGHWKAKLFLLLLSSFLEMISPPNILSLLENASSLNKLFALLPGIFHVFIQFFVLRS